MARCPSTVAPPWLPMAGTMNGRAPASFRTPTSVRTTRARFVMPRLPTPMATVAPGWIRPRTALCARETKRIELGTAVMPTFPRHPHAMAQQALSAQAIAGGRFTLGIGLSHQIVIEGMLGLSFAKPYSHMKEYLAVLGPLIRSGSVSHWGTEYRVNAQLAVPGAKPCAILVAALAPRMLALTGREAEGTITWMTGPKTIREHTAPRIREAATGVG